MLIGTINNIIPFSSVDGPGNRTAVFFQGCNFNCLYCHNPETISICANCGICVSKCPNEALEHLGGKVTWNEDVCTSCDTCITVCRKCSTPKTKAFTVSQLVHEVSKYKNFISGVTVSGGECTIQAEFITHFFSEIKKMKLTCFVDSNGSHLFEEMPELTERMDKVMLDVKAWSLEDHLLLTGVSNEIVLENLAYLSSIDKLFEVRTVVVPNLVNNKLTIEKVSQFLGIESPSVRYKLIKYRPIGVREKYVLAKTPSQSYMEELKQLALSNGCHDVVIV